MTALLSARNLIQSKESVVEQIILQNLCKNTNLETMTFIFALGRDDQVRMTWKNSDMKRRQKQVKTPDLFSFQQTHLFFYVMS